MSQEGWAVPEFRGSLKLEWHHGFIILALPHEGEILEYSKLMDSLILLWKQGHCALDSSKGDANACWNFNVSVKTQQKGTHVQIRSTSRCPLKNLGCVAVLAFMFNSLWCDRLENVAMENLQWERRKNLSLCLCRMGCWRLWDTEAPEYPPIGLVQGHQEGHRGNLVEL